MKTHKTLYPLFCFIFFVGGLLAQQTGTINYSETHKLEIEGVNGLDLGDMLPSEISAGKSLYFDNGVSVYRDAEDNVDEDVEMTSDDGSFKMIIETSSVDEVLYTNLKEKISLNQTGFMGKEFLIESLLDKPKWKITNEKIKYLGYVCQKATMTRIIEASHGTGEEAQEQEVVAWFTTEIPVSIGPGSYNQLPGAILMVSVDDGKTEIKATEVRFEAPVKFFLETPTKGQKVTQEEYEKIIAEKTKEIQEMHGDREGTSIPNRG